MGTGNNKVNPSLCVYLVGIILLGATYELIKPALGGGVLFVCAVVIYLLALRLIGNFISRKWHERKST